jgi:hypothetical protein
MGSPFRFALVFACTLASAQQPNPLARPAAPTAAAIAGRWNGVDLEKRTSCTQSQNNGNRGTYAQFDIIADDGGNLTITQSGITGLNCTYMGRFQPDRMELAVEGSYSCSDGKQGSVSNGRLTVHGLSLDLRMAIRLTGSESCEIDGLLSMARLPN